MLQKLQDIELRITKLETEFKLVKSLVFGGVALVLTSVLGYAVALLVK